MSQCKTPIVCDYGANNNHNYYTNEAFCQNEQQISILNPCQTSFRDSSGFTGTSTDASECEEQEFYEEMLVDGRGQVKQKKIVILRSPSSDNRNLNTKHRYEYIPMHGSPPRSADRNFDHHRYDYIPDSPKEMKYYRHPGPVNTGAAPPLPKRYQAAQQRSYELLQTPPKRMGSFEVTAMRPDPFMTPPKPKAQQCLRYNGSLLMPKSSPPRRLRPNTAIVAPICSPSPAVYNETTTIAATNTSAISKPLNSAYLDPFREKKPPLQATLAIAAIMMLLCGSVTTALSFYMVSIMGRLYFLDFSSVAGFACLMLGFMGYRTRNCFWLPNRNYISGYILLSLFSLLTCSALVILLVYHPKAGTPLADMTSGAVCGISVLSILLASTGVISSYCCKYPPPDNRVQHSVPGFSV